MLWSRLCDLTSAVEAGRRLNGYTGMMRLSFSYSTSLILYFRLYTFFFLFLVLRHLSYFFSVASLTIALAQHYQWNCRHFLLSNSFNLFIPSLQAEWPLYLQCRPSTKLYRECWAKVRAFFIHYTLYTPSYLLLFLVLEFTVHDTLCLSIKKQEKTQSQICNVRIYFVVLKSVYSFFIVYNFFFHHPNQWPTHY